MAEPAAGPLPAVSVVVPTYNRCAWLPGTIDSVLEQDYADLELVVLDDGSTDATEEVLARYSAEFPATRFRAEGQENMGQSRSLNKGFEIARGELLSFLSDDDRLLPGAIERLVRGLLANPEAVVAFGPFHLVDPDGARLDTSTPPEFRLAEVLRMHDLFIGPGNLIRRNALAKAGPMNPELSLCLDTDLWIRMALVGPFVRVSEPVGLYTDHGGRLTRSVHGSGRLARERLDMLDGLYARADLPDDVIEIKDDAYMNALIASGIAIGGESASDDDARFGIVDRLVAARSARALAEARAAEEARECALAARNRDLAARNRDLAESHRRARRAERAHARLERRVARLRHRIRRGRGGAGGRLRRWPRALSRRLKDVLGGGASHH
jgi:glycosyltransferase involved in cell wall biosynthesis